MSDNTEQYDFAVKTTLTDTPARYVIEFADMSEENRDVDDEINDLVEFLEEHKKDGLSLDIELMRDRSVDFVKAYKEPDKNLLNIARALGALYHRSWQAGPAIRGMFAAKRWDTDGYYVSEIIDGECVENDNRIEVAGDADTFIKATIGHESRHEDSVHRYATIQRIQNGIGLSSEELATLLAYETFEYKGDKYWARPCLSDEL